MYITCNLIDEATKEKKTWTKHIPCMVICLIITCVATTAGLVYVIIQLHSESGINTAQQMTSSSVNAVSQNVTSLSEEHQSLIQALQIRLEEQNTQIVDLKSRLEAQKLDQDMQKLQLGQFNLILGTCDSEIETFALPSENYK